MKDKTDDIWRFIFFANNGALIGDGICIIFGQNLVNLSPVILTGIILFYRVTTTKYESRNAK